MSYFNCLLQAQIFSNQYKNCSVSYEIQILLERVYVLWCCLPLQGSRTLYLSYIAYSMVQGHLQCSPFLCLREAGHLSNSPLVYLVEGGHLLYSHLVRLREDRLCRYIKMHLCISLIRTTKQLRYQHIVCSILLTMQLRQVIYASDL